MSANPVQPLSQTCPASSRLLCLQGCALLIPRGATDQFWIGLGPRCQGISPGYNNAAPFGRRRSCSPIAGGSQWRLAAVAASFFCEAACVFLHLTLLSNWLGRSPASGSDWSRLGFAIQGVERSRLARHKRHAACRICGVEALSLRSELFQPLEPVVLIAWICC